jgi:hypothetical protein
MDRWNLLLLLAASYVAVTSLVRMMIARRDRLVAEVQNQLDGEKRRRKAKQAYEKAE